MLTPLLFFGILRTTCVYGTLQSLQNDFAHKLSLSRCVLRAVDCCVGHGETVTVAVYSLEAGNDSTIQFEQILFDDLGKSNKVTYNVKKTVRNRPSHRTSAFRHPPGAYVIHVKGDLKDLGLTLRMLSNEPDWNPSSRFMIVTTQVYKNFEVEAERARRFLLNLKLINCIGLLADGENTQSYDVYRLHLDGECGYAAKPVPIDKCVNGSGTKDWFEDYLPKDLKGCKLKVSTSLIEPFVITPTPQITHDHHKYNLTEGLEVKLLNTIAKYTNSTINYTVTQSQDIYGKIFPNGTFTGSYKDLAEKKIDIIMGYVVSRSETQVVFDTISSYFQDSLIFCVAHAKLEEKWIRAAKVFINWSQTASMVTVIILVGVLIRFFSKLLEIEITKYTSPQEIFFRLLRLYYGGTENILPRTNTIRLLVLSCVMFSFFYRTLYSSHATRQLFTPKWGYQVNTDREIAQKIVQYYPLCLNYFDGELKKIKQLQFCQDYFRCLAKTTESYNYATCMPKLNVQYLLGNFYDTEGYPLLYCFKKNIASYPIEMLMWKGHPLKPRINDLVNRLSAGGFVSKWEKEIFDNPRMKSKVAVFETSDKMVVKISHLFIALILYASGNAMAILVFVVENVTYKYSSNKREKIQLKTN